MSGGRSGILEQLELLDCSKVVVWLREKCDFDERKENRAMLSLLAVALHGFQINLRMHNVHLSEEDDFVSMVKVAFYPLRGMAPKYVELDISKRANLYVANVRVYGSDEDSSVVEDERVGSDVMDVLTRNVENILRDD